MADDDLRFLSPHDFEPLYLNESWEILADAIRHASHAAQTLADLYLMPVFGWTT